MDDLLRHSLVDLIKLLRERKASPVELMREVLDAVDRHNPELNAIVTMRDREALLQDAQLAEGRIQIGVGGALEGIPFGVKDLEDVAGLPTTHGAKPFRDHVPAQDSVQVERLRHAGAIVVGKTNVPEFGSNAITRNLLFGVTRSPWNPQRTPGGSSGGSAAALAAEMLPLVTASDGGGSIRIPASFVGAFGLKTSFGRIPRSPLDEWEHGATSVYGPLTKTVADAALILDQVSGYDTGDPRSLPDPGIRYAEAVKEPLDSGLRLAYCADLGYAVVQSDIAAAAEEAACTFEKLGHTVEAVKGGPPDMGGDWGLLSAFEIGARIAHLRPEQDGDFSRGLLQTVRFTEQMSHVIWARISQRRVQLVKWCDDMFDKYHAILTPTVPYDPPSAKGPWPTETEGRPQITASVAAFTVPFNLAWYPAASVPMGLSRAGLPMGLQIVGPHHRDDWVLRLARAFEQERPWHGHWPLR